MKNETPRKGVRKTGACSEWKIPPNANGLEGQSLTSLNPLRISLWRWLIARSGKGTAGGTFLKADVRAHRP
jgi:hypothetical protein